jgi:hypothetical protein
VQGGKYVMRDGEPVPASKESAPAKPAPRESAAAKPAPSDSKSKKGGEA